MRCYANQSMCIISLSLKKKKKKKSPFRASIPATNPIFFTEEENKDITRK